MDGEVLGKGADRPRRNYADIDGREWLELPSNVELPCNRHGRARLEAAISPDSLAGVGVFTRVPPKAR